MSKTETETENTIEEKKTTTAKFAEWLMRRDEARTKKETSLEGLLKFNIFLSTITVVGLFGTTAIDYALMAWLWI
jgi:hypothetical protein